MVAGRRLSIGAEIGQDQQAHFRVWAPNSRHVHVVLENEQAEIPLAQEGGGYFSGTVSGIGAGTLYRFRLDDGQAYPDPASRFQPEGPHGPSMLVDPSTFQWSDGNWKGKPLRGQVIYELHIGTFTQEGNWKAAEQYLSDLRDVGVTSIEVMPIADFPGEFNWGYDGVNMFAPSRVYGSPDDFRAFVDRAHSLNLAVILDVVYNHFGPDGNYLHKFSEDYFTTKYENEWGKAINFDGPRCLAVRQFFLENVRYWISEFHLDGLRLDATQQIFDDSPTNILAEIGKTARQAAEGREIIIVCENERQDSRLIRPEEQNGFQLDAMWNDDFHHSALVSLTGLAEAYYSDYLGTAQEFLAAIKWGFLYQGQRYRWQKSRRGTPALDLAPERFITFLENHDQVANSSRGLRAHQLSSPARFRAMSALFLLAPGTPMLFQGQEFASSKPFFYFADHGEELAALVREGRKKHLSQFPSIAASKSDSLVEPSLRKTFLRCKLDHEEKKTNVAMLRLHTDLLTLRRESEHFTHPELYGFDGAVMSDWTFVLRLFGPDDDDRLVIVNLGRQLRYDPAPIPLLAPPALSRWRTIWSSEHPDYGGTGTPELDTEENWIIPGEATVVLGPTPLNEK